MNGQFTPAKCGQGHWFFQYSTIWKMHCIVWDKTKTIINQRNALSGLQVTL
jgi:hypothetical protein